MSAPTAEKSAREFPPERTAVRAARTYATDSPISEGVDLDVLALVVSELATNAVLHAKTPFVVALERLSDGVRVGVTDTEPTLPGIRDVDLSTITGRGLGIVRSLSRELRIQPSRAGKTVWFELGWATA